MIVEESCLVSKIVIMYLIGRLYKFTIYTNALHYQDMKNFALSYNSNDWIVENTVWIILNANIGSIY